MYLTTRDYNTLGSVQFVLYNKRLGPKTFAIRELFREERKGSKGQEMNGT